MKKVRITIKTSNRAYVYLRVSTDEQAKDAYGLDSQLRACREFCDKRGWTISEVFSDPGVSGWADVERPGFLKMMKAIRGNPHVNLVIYDYSRFGRDTRRALNAFEKLDQLGILTVAATNPGIDCSTAAGRTARRNELSNAEDFSDQHSEKQQARMKAAFEDGRWCRRPPLGYCTVGTKIKGHANIVPLKAEADLIRKSFELVHTGNDRPAKVLREITDLGLRSKRGKKLTVSTLLETLRNPVYIGQMRSKKHGIGKGLHEPLVSEPIFRNVQRILNGDKPVSAPYQLNRPDFPLRQFLRCSECNRPLTGGPSRSHTGKTYNYYHCYKCRAAKSLPANKAFNDFLSVLRRLRVDAHFSIEFTAILREEWNNMSGDSAAIVQRLTADLNETREKQNNLLMKYLSDDTRVLPYFDALNRQFENHIAAVEARIMEADMMKATFAQLSEFSNLVLADIASAWEIANIDQKQRIQNVLFPSGLKYHPRDGIVNSHNNPVFDQLESFLGRAMQLAV